MSHLTEWERQYYTTTFIKMNKDGNGYIDIGELGEFFESTDPDVSFKKVTKVFHKTDDGKIALHEFLAVAPSVTQADQDEDAKLARIFNKIDTNGEGLTLEEVHTALCEKGEDVSLSRAEKIVNKMDDNGDGKIDQLELLTYNRMKKMLNKLAH